MALRIPITPQSDELRELVDEFNSRVDAQQVAVSQAESIPQTLAEDAETLPYAKLKKRLDEGNARIHELKQQAVSLALERGPLLEHIYQDARDRHRKAERALADIRRQTESALRKVGFGATEGGPHSEVQERKLNIQVNEASPVRQADNAVLACHSAVNNCEQALRSVEQTILDARQELRSVTNQLLLKV